MACVPTTTICARCCWCWTWSHAPRRRTALGAAGSGIVGRHAQARHRAQKLVGIDIGADLAGGGRSLEKRAKGGPESLVEVSRQVVEGRISRVQGLGEPAFGGDEGRVALHPSRQGLEGLVLGRQDRRGIGAGVDFTTEDGGDQIRALRKVAIDRADADAGLLGDLPHRRVHARGREHRHGRLQQRVEIALRVGAHAAATSGPRARRLAFLGRFVAHRKTSTC